MRVLAQRRNSFRRSCAGYPGSSWYGNHSESTANGMGEFHERWQQAEAGIGEGSGCLMHDSHMRGVDTRRQVNAGG